MCYQQPGPVGPVSYHHHHHHHHHHPNTSIKHVILDISTTTNQQEGSLSVRPSIHLSVHLSVCVCVVCVVIVGLDTLFFQVTHLRLRIETKREAEIETRKNTLNKN